MIDNLFLAVGPESLRKLGRDGSQLHGQAPVVAGDLELALQGGGDRGKVLVLVLPEERVQGSLLGAGVGDVEDIAQGGLAVDEADDGDALGVAADDGRFSPLTIIGGTLKMENGRMVQSMDSRFPTNTSGEALTAAPRASTGRKVLNL